MDPRERFDAPLEALETAADDHASTLWTAMPGIVQSYNAATGTVAVQLALRSTVQKPDGTYQQVAIPVLDDVPVCFPQGGGVVMTFPIAAGDECLVVFASRCIDSWWQSGGVQEQAFRRMHSLSDGFAFIGPRSRGRAVGGASTSAVQLRSVDGTSSISLNATSGRIDMVAPGGVYINGINFSTHRHTGVQIGGGVSGGPTA